ncbi:hypothetical protein K8T06_17085 [bacterium]|nr:hypothetical protein [bacterium]
MKNRQFSNFQLLALSLVLIAFCYSSRASEDVIRSVELKLLWEKTVDFEYDGITPDAKFERFVAKKSLGSFREHFIFLNSTFDEVFEIQTSKYGIYGIDNGRINIFEHRDYLKANESKTLSKLNLVVNEVVYRSTNNRFLGVIQMYYNNKTNRFDRRFQFFEIDETCHRKLLWEKDPLCPAALSNPQARTKNYKYTDWEYCLNDFSIAKNGNVMLIAGQMRGGVAQRMMVFNRNGMVLLDVDETSSVKQIWGFCLNNIGEFYYGEYTFGSPDMPPRYFFDAEGKQIEKEEYHKRTDLKPYDVYKLPFWTTGTSSYPDRIMGHDFFTDKNGLNIVYLKAKHKYGHYLSLYSIDKKEEVWRIENEKAGYQFGRPTVLKNGNLILITRKKSWNQEECDFKTYRKNSLKTPTERLFINKKGEIIHAFKEIGKWKIESEAKRILFYSNDGNFKMYGFTTSK